MGRDLLKVTQPVGGEAGHSLSGIHGSGILPPVLTFRTKVVGHQAPQLVRGGAEALPMSRS